MVEKYLKKKHFFLKGFAVLFEKKKYFTGKVLDPIRGFFA